MIEENQKESFFFRYPFVLPVIFVLVLWIIEGCSLYFHYDLSWAGIIPRSIVGLIGIFTAPFVHGSIDHLLSNTLPLLIVGTGLIYFYKEIAFRVISMVWLFTGFWVWLAARPDAHIGASGLIYGFVCFLFFSGLIRRDTRLLAISLLVTFLYGSMVWGILPVDQRISWESHLFGSVAGLFGAIYFRKQGPQRPKAQWEIDEEIESMQSSTEENVSESFPKNNEQALNIRYDYIEKDNSGDAENDPSKNQ